MARTYRQALDYLNQFVNYERSRSAPYSPETLNLDRMRALLSRLGDPHQAFPAIHIAGTKGKGSIAAMAESILRAAGYRTGLYTSPHLHTFRERMRVNGELASRESIARQMDDIEPHVAAVPGVTWFEIVTALGFHHFSRSRIDMGVIEVGLGGRFDATNVVTPLVSVIASLSLDHTAWLGDTLDKIAFEKAGIIKPGVPVVSAPQKPEALAVLERVAAERGSALTVIGRDLPYSCAALPFSESGSAGVEVRVADHTFRVPLAGEHQADNAVLALAAVRQAKGRLTDDDAVADDDAARGLARVHWPGRFEIARRDPPLVIDGAHNADSAGRLAATLEAVFPGARWTLVFGASSDKDIAGMLHALLPSTDRVIVTRAHSTRAADLESIAGSVSDHARPVEIASGVAEAMGRALEADAPTVVTGSLYVVAEAREAWFQRAGLPMPERDDAE